MFGVVVNVRAAVDQVASASDHLVSALGICVQAQVLDLLEERQARIGTALLFILHDLGVVQNLSNRVLVFHRGRIVERGPVTAEHPIFNLVNDLRLGSGIALR